MAGRGQGRGSIVTRAQTPKVRDPETQRALDVISAAIHELQERRLLDLFDEDTPGYVPASGGESGHFLAADGTWKTIVGSGAVDSVTAGSSAVTVSPTTGAVVVDVVEANFSGIPQSAVTDLVADLAARPTGSGTANAIPKWTSTGVLGDSQISDDGAIVGIGNTFASIVQINPIGGVTTVGGTLGVTGAADFNSTVNVDGTLTLSTMTPGSVLFAGLGGLVSQDNAGLFYDDANNWLGVGTNTRSDNTGFLGSTVSNLEVQGAANSSTMALAACFSTTAEDAGYFLGVRGRGSRSAPATVNSGDNLAAFTGSGYNSSTVNRFSAGAQMLVTAEGTWTTSSFPARLGFQTVPSGSSALVQRMTITNGGDVIVGASTALTKSSLAGPFEATKDSANTDITISAYGTGVSPTLRAFRGRGTAAATTALGSGDIIGDLSFTGAATATGVFTGAFIRATTTQAWTGSLCGTKLEFSTTPNTAAGSRAVRLTLDQDGTATFANNVVVTGSLTANGNTAIGNASGDAHSLTGTLALNATAGSNGQIAQISGGVPVWGAASTAGIPTGTGTANTLVKWTGASTQGNSSIADTGTVVDVGVDTTKFGATFDGALYVDATIPSINFRYDLNSTANGAINYSGYNGSNTQFRNLGIYDGKNADIVFFTGSSKTSAFAGPVTMASTLAVNGNTTLGDDAADTTTINGPATLQQTLTVTGAASLNSTATVAGLLKTSSELQVDNAVTGITSHIHWQGDASLPTFLRSGTTGGSVHIGDSNTGGIYLGSATNNTSVYGSLGVSFDASITGTLAVGGVATFFDDVAVGGALTVTGEATANGFTTGNLRLGANALNNSASALFLQYYNPALGVQIGDGTTACPTAVKGSLSVTGDVTLGDAGTDTLTVSGYAGFGVVPNSTAQVYIDGSGRTYALYVTGVAQFNGNCTLGDSTSGDSHTINGTSVITSSNTVSYPLRINNTAVGMTLSGLATLYVNPQNSMDATAANREHYGLRVLSTVTKSAGANLVTAYGLRSEVVSAVDVNIAGYFDASGAPTDIALVTSNGSNYLNSSNGETGIGYTAGAALSAKLDVSGSFRATGNATLGDAVSDSHTINGLTTLNAANTNGLNVVNTAASQAGNYHGVDVAMGGSYDTTVGALFPMAVEAVISATKAAGANALTNTALYAEATGGDTNYGIWVAAGSARFDGNVTLGSATTNSHTINGITGITGRASDNISLYLRRDTTGSGINFVMNGAIGGSTATTIEDHNTNDLIEFENGNTHVYTSLTARGTFTSLGAATLNSTLAVTGIATLSSSLNVTGAATLSSTLRVTGVAQFDGDVNIGDAAADTIAFHGAAGSTQETVTGSRGGSAALADLITKLANKGLIVDGTTP